MQFPFHYLYYHSVLIRHLYSKDREKVKITQEQPPQTSHAKSVILPFNITAQLMWRRHTYAPLLWLGIKCVSDSFSPPLTINAAIGFFHGRHSNYIFPLQTKLQFEGMICFGKTAEERFAHPKYHRPALKHCNFCASHHFVTRNTKLLWKKIK